LYPNTLPAYNGSMEIGSSVSGIQQAFQTHTERASRIAKATAEDAEIDATFVKDMAELPSDDKAVGFNAAAIKTQDKMLGALLDIFA
jgi:hypothetical protein